MDPFVLLLLLATTAGKFNHDDNILPNLFDPTASQETDVIDATFSDIVSQIDNLESRQLSPFDGRFFYDTEPGLEHLFPRVKSLAQKLRKLLTELHRGGLEDEAEVLKYGLIKIASFLPWFDSVLSGNRPSATSDKDIEKSVDELDSLIGRFEKVASNYRRMAQSERQSFKEKNQKTIEVLATRQAKLIKKCFYLKSRLIYLMKELYSLPTGSRNLGHKLSTWKRFIENNEYLLNQRMTRDEKERLYSFISSKLKEAEGDLSQSENLIFDLV